MEIQKEKIDTLIHRENDWDGKSIKCNAEEQKKVGLERVWF